MNTQAEIEKWTRILERNIAGPNHRTAQERLSAYLCSLSLGREFGEAVDAYFERRGFVEFKDWAKIQLTS